MSKKHVLYCSSSSICTVHVLVPVLFLFWYLHCKSSDTPSHSVLEGSTINWYLHSHLVPTLHVIQYHLVWYQYCAHPVLHVIQYHLIWYSMSSSTISSGTNTVLIQYSKSSSTRRFYSQLVPAQSSSTHSPCHLVPTLHVIQYLDHLVPVIAQFVG
jgi:hypothetical protein